MKILRSVLFLFVTISAHSAIAQKSAYTPVYDEVKSAWADSVFQSLSLEERIGQLFMVAAYSNKDAAH